MSNVYRVYNTITKTTTNNIIEIIINGIVPQIQYKNISLLSYAMFCLSVF